MESGGGLATATGAGGTALDADQALEAVLDGFIENPPTGVGLLQQLRNAIVRPLGLRTAPLACGVSSLLGGLPETFAHEPANSDGNADGGVDGCVTQRTGADADARVFAGRFPVYGVARDGGARVAVVLGADDTHLRFRTTVGVDLEEQCVVMSTAVEPKTTFGKFYATVVDPVHRW
jgi:hypothetical protein